MVGAGSGRGSRGLPWRIPWLAVVVTAVATPLVAAAALEVGAWSAVRSADSSAASMRQSGDYRDAVAQYRVVAGRGGPLYALANGIVSTASQKADATLLDWGTSLAHAGRVDEALQVIGWVTDPGLHDRALRQRGTTLLDAAAAAASGGHFDTALARLDQLSGLDAPADLVARAGALRPAYALGAGRQLLREGRPGDAVQALDQVVSGGGAQAATARALLPDALLAAGRAAIAANDESTALTDLRRLTQDFGTTPQAGTARQLLAAPQPVSGTVVRRGGSGVGGLLVRLGSRYRKEGSGYLTSSPYYSTTTDSRGDFRIDNVPLTAEGQFYVLELFENGWTTVIDDHGNPTYTVTVQPLTPVDMTFVVLPG